LYKKAIVPARASIGVLLTIYMMENRYGNSWYETIQKEFLMNK